MKALWRGASLAIVSLGVLVACSVTPGDPNGLRVDPPTEPMAMTLDVAHQPTARIQLGVLSPRGARSLADADGATSPASGACVHR